MVPAQRKRHLIIWTILAIVLPILFILSIMVIPKMVHQDQLYQEQTPKTINH